MIIGGLGNVKGTRGHGVVLGGGTLGQTLHKRSGKRFMVCGINSKKTPKPVLGGKAHAMDKSFGGSTC